MIVNISKIARDHLTVIADGMPVGMVVSNMIEKKYRKQLKQHAKYDRGTEVCMRRISSKRLDDSFKESRDELGMGY